MRRQLTPNEGDGSFLEHLLALEGFHIVEIFGSSLRVYRQLTCMSEPRVSQGVFSRDSASRINGHEFADQVLGLERYVIPLRTGEMKSTGSDLLEDLLIIPASKGWISTKHDVHTNSGTPQIAGISILFRQNLRRYVIRCALFFGHDLAWLEILGRAKVNNLQITIIISGGQQEVLRF